MMTKRIQPHSFSTGRKRLSPGSIIFEYYRRLAEADEQRRKPQPTKPVYAKGSMEWFAEQENSR
jgi:hypothetical protein